MPLLHTQALRIGYPGQAQVVAEGLALELKAGELVCLLGPNGAGKSTLLRTLSGSLRPLGGQFFLQNKPAHQLSAREWAQARSVVLTQFFPPGQLTVAALLALGRAPYTGWWGRLSAEDHRAVAQALEATGIQALGKRAVAELSDGERQKVMIARALAQDTPLILLDEPTAHLDLPNRVEVLQLLQNLAREQDKGILLSTHDLDLALQAADRLWLMRAGRPLQSGLPEALALAGSLAETFQKPNFVLDVKTGGFRLQSPIRGQVHLVGEGKWAYWTMRALLRKGIAINPDSGSSLGEVRVSSEAEAPSWLFTGPDIKLKVATLADLLALLESRLSI